MPFALVMSAPSGCGKSSVERKLLDHPLFVASISATTRTRRAGEIDGRDYLFYDTTTFRDLVAKGEVLEWAEIYGNLYGTPKAPAMQAVKKGLVPLLVIDPQGHDQVRAHLAPELVRSIYLLPPSLDELKRRLRRRGDEDAASIQRRLNAAAEEMRRSTDYDLELVNDDLEKTAAAVAAFAEEQVSAYTQTLSG